MACESNTAITSVNESDEPPLATGIESALFDAAETVRAPSQKLVELSALDQWTDWRWQMRHRIRSVSKLAEYFPAIDASGGMRDAVSMFPLAITPYYASLIAQPVNTDPIFRMAVPQAQELCNPPFLTEDPLEEERNMPVPGLVHRYEDRALLISTSSCATYCRHCTRKRVTGAREGCVSPARLRRWVEYLRKHPEISDVIVSGGDPFTMPTSWIESVLKAIRSVKTVGVIRFGTRVPVTLPFRITSELTDVLRAYHPVWVNTHFNHPVELTPEAAAACERLVNAGVPVGNQTVLLRGVNDNAHVMEELLRGLIRIRVRPYYLFQCDLVPGVEHFRTPLSRGIEIMEALRGRLSGIAIPAFVVDTPHGGGKIPVLPNYVVSTSPTHTVLRNYEGMLVAYPEPSAGARTDATGPTDDSAATVWELASGRFSKIQPERNGRRARRRPQAGPACDEVSSSESLGRDFFY